MSLEPWEKAKAEAVKTCIQEKRRKVDVASDFFFRERAKMKTAIHTTAPTMPMTKRF